MKTAELRQTFVDFFKSKGHTFVPGSSTIPIGDQTLLFTTAGMVQFKSALTGEEVRPYKRATNYQKCVRVKDLDNVGKNGRHHTMFEMLGNWSFGDFYKKEIIPWAYEFVKDVVKMDLTKLWVSVHISDDEAYDIWRSIGMPTDRIVRLDEDNFWAMGPTGPCGPCSELYMDQGPTVGQDYHKRTGTKCKENPGCECDRFLEFWNCVFMQYDRQEDGTLNPLPFKSVDTGAGLERFAALLQGKTSNFDIDIFQNIKNAIRTRAQLPHGVSESPDITESLNVVADHVRMLTFTLADGIVFSNEGRGYVLRRVLRRAVRHAHRLNPNLPKDESFLADIVPAIIAEMGAFYPEIVENQKRVMEAIRVEELRFSRTLAVGLERFQTFVAEAKTKGSKVLPGEQVFLLHDTFGFPSDLTQVLCEEQGMQADLEGFAVYMKQQKEKSRAEAKFYKFDQDESPWVVLREGEQKDEKTFTGYGIHQATGEFDGREIAEIPLIAGQLRRVRQLQNGLFEAIVAKTPFYAESGGQTADSGWLAFGSGTESEVFEVIDVRKGPTSIVHLLRHPDYSSEDAERLSEAAVRKIFSERAVALIDFTQRAATARNHTATHLLQKALQIVLGEGIRQAGSMVDASGLRFDFTHGKALTADEISRAETLANEEILRNQTVLIHENVPLQQAREMGAMAIFDEKYEDHVRVVEVPGYSMELCGGTHVKSTGNIGLLKVISEGSVTAGVRRLEAVTGMGVYQYTCTLKNTLQQAAEEAGASDKDLSRRIRSLRDDLKERERTIAALESRLVAHLVKEHLDKATEPVAGVKVVAALSTESSAQAIELLTDRLKEKNISVVVTGGAVDGKAMVFAAVNPAVTKAHKAITAGNIVKQVCELVDGKGGGRPDFARGGGNSPEKLAQALAEVDAIVRKLAQG